VDSHGPKEASATWGAHWRHLAIMNEPFMFGGPAKTAEPLEVPFGVWTWVSPRERALDGVQIAPCQGAVFRAKDMPGMLDDTLL